MARAAMFRPAPMVRVNALVLQRDERALLYALGRAGVVHLTRTEAGPDTAPLDPPDRTEDLLRCDDLLRRVHAVRETLALQHSPLSEAAVEMPLEQAAHRLQEIEQQLEELGRRKNGLEQQSSQITTVLHQLENYQGLSVPMDELGKATFLHFAIGSLPAENLDKLRDTTDENVVLLPLDSNDKRRPVVAITSRKGRFAMETTLKQAGFRHEKPPAESGQEMQALTRESRQRQEQLTADLDQLAEDQQELADRSAPILAVIEQAVREERAILDAQQHFPHTGSALLVTGWVPAEQAASVDSELRRVTRGRCVVRIEQPDDIPSEQIPILLRPPSWLRPFGMLVTGFGLPGYRDFEPTLLVAISYLVMFGIMFGDVGHGAVLALGGLAMRFWLRDPRGRDTGFLVLMAGLSSILFGAIYGSYFGIPALHEFGLWHDPLHAPVQLMVATVGVGVVMISIGVILNIINQFRRGDVLGGILDKFGLVGIVFYWGSLIFVVKYATLSEMNLAGLVLVLCIALPLLAVTLKEPLQYALSKRAGHTPHSDNLFMALIESLIEAFEAVLAYLANTISFVRLAAYAMSHAAILMATFAVADAIADAPGVGGVLYVLVVIAGNLVALVLEGVVVAVQVLRLEYYEFFGKFFSGDGLPFRPFSFLGKEKEIT